MTPPATLTKESSVPPTQGLLDFLSASPSPWHAVDAIAKALQEAGFMALEEADPWELKAGQGYYVIRGGSSIIAFRPGSGPWSEHGIRIIGAHTDSPGLRLKPKGAHLADHHLRVGVEPYGGPILATWSDRDLGLAGRIYTLAQDGNIQQHLVRVDAGVARLPNLAIHMNRDVNENGLKFNKQSELPLLLDLPTDPTPPEQAFSRWLATAAGLPDHSLLAWDLGVYDVQPPALVGIQQDWIASRHLDNLASCHAALRAMMDAPPGDVTTLCAWFDHEEVGSESPTGAAGNFIQAVVERLAEHDTPPGGGRREDWYRGLARSFLISVDMAHAFHPNFPQAYEPNHRIFINHGPAIKLNANQRYTSTGETSARFLALCEQNGLPCQRYVHRSDLGCGSTIGPLLAARLGISSIDIGNPLWAMHSIRETAGVRDHDLLIRALTLALSHRHLNP